MSEIELDDMGNPVPHDLGETTPPGELAYDPVTEEEYREAQATLEAAATVPDDLPDGAALAPEQEENAAQATVDQYKREQGVTKRRVS